MSFLFHYFHTCFLPHAFLLYFYTSKRRPAPDSNDDSNLNEDDEEVTWSDLDDDDYEYNNDEDDDDEYDDDEYDDEDNEYNKDDEADAMEGVESEAVKPAPPAPVRQRNW